MRNCQTHQAKTQLHLPQRRKNYNTVLYIWKLVLSMIRAEWMSGICLIRSRGRLISPSLPVGDDRYLNLGSQKRPPGRNLGEHRLVRRSGTTSRGTVVLVFCSRMRSFPRNELLTIFLRTNMRVGSTKDHTMLKVYNRTSSLHYVLVSLV